MRRRLIPKIVAIFAAMLFVVMYAISGTAVGVLIGDADGDGVIASIDAATVQRVIAGIFTDADGAIARRGDVTGGGLSLTDATAIQRYLAGHYDGYHIGEIARDDVPCFPIEDNQLPIL